MKKVLLTNPCAPYDLGWGEDMMDLLASRLARGHDIANLKSHLPAWGLYLIAENLRNPTTVLEHPQWEDFLAELDKGYDVIGIQLKTINLARAVKMVEAIRKYSPRTEIVIGGYGVSALDAKLPGDTEDLSGWLKRNVDHLCHEEGVKYMRKLLGDEPFDRPITQYHMPYANFHLPGMRDFDLNIPAILVSLGCPNACDFCNTSAFFKHKKFYVAEPEEVVRFMRHHVERLNVETLNVILFDEDIFLNTEYVRELGRLLRADRKLWGVRWISFGSVKALAPFTAEELRDCGVGGIWIGVESGLVDGECAKEGFGKRDGGQDPRQLFDDLQRYGIETIGSMILGFDFHTPENIEKDIDYFVGLKPMFYQIGPLTPCPGTKLYREFIAEGRLKSNYNYQHFHLWKDDGIDYKHFGEGGIKKWFDLAHEKLRTVLGPPTLQFAELNLRAYETLRDHPSEYLRHQAGLARELAAGAMPLVRATGRHPPSPAVKQRVRELVAKAGELLEPAPLHLRAIGKVVELVATAQAERTDRLERPQVVSDPGARWSYYHQGSDVPTRRGAFGKVEKQGRAATMSAVAWGRPKQRVEPESEPRLRVAQAAEAPPAAEEAAKKRLAVVG
ncbi:MAG: radical SAM protein [Polyangiaceae bacterium]|nr:radical SAM protein [Polyangiaceae bacterium]